MTDVPVEITIPRPDDWHVHLRDDAMLSAVVGWTARRYRHALVMPNLRPPIADAAAAAAYRRRILDRVPDHPDTASFRPLMTVFASPDLDVDDLRVGVEEGVVAAVKFYPPGATTNSDQALGSLGELDDLLEALCALGVRLLVHAESTDPTVDIFDREAVFLERELAPVRDRHPDLAVTVEHVSTAAGVEFVRAHPHTVATITPHHLARTRSDLLANGMRPDLYCKPVINAHRDRAALVAAATSGDARFFCGTDSAPHPTTAKYGPRAAAGIFNAPYGLEVLAEVFHQHGALGSLGAFVSDNGCRSYGMAPPDEHVLLRRSATPRSEDAAAERLITETGDEVVFFGHDEARWWTVTPVGPSGTSVPVSAGA